MMIQLKSLALIKNNCLPFGGIGVHCVNAFPVKPSAQEQIETCFITWQLALMPQEPGHGSLHF